MNSFKCRVSRSSARTKMMVYCIGKELNCLRSLVFPKEMQVANTWYIKACGDQLSSASRSSLALSIWVV